MGAFFFGGTSADIAGLRRLCASSGVQRVIRLETRHAGRLYVLGIRDVALGQEGIDSERR